MRIVGVIDLMAGSAVHARGGARDRYAPLQAVGGTPLNGDPLAAARLYTERFALDDVYVADLDAIRGGAWQSTLVTSLAAVTPSLWLDAGIATADAAARAVDLGASRMVVGLETLPSLQALRQICGTVAGERVVFSLDLRDGQPMRLPDGADGSSPEALARGAVAAGATAVIVLDIARVGMATGPDLELIARVRRAVPDVMLLAGGGVRGADDLRRLEDAGCDGALVATALQSGAIGRPEGRPT